MARRTRRTGTADSWKDIEFKKNELEYTPEEFVIPARDSKGASTRMFFRMSPSTERALEVILQQRKFPYKTVSDVIRHAVFRHLGFLHKMEPDMPQHYYASLEAIAEIVREDEHRSYMESVFKGLAERVDTHLASGDLGEAVRVAALTLAKIGALPDSAWKRRYQDTYSRKFKNLLRMQQPDQGVGGKKILKMPSLGSGVDKDEDD